MYHIHNISIELHWFSTRLYFLKRVPELLSSMYYIRHAIYRSENGENLTKDAKFDFKIEERSSICRFPLILILLKTIFSQFWRFKRPRTRQCFVLKGLANPFVWWFECSVYRILENNTRSTMFYHHCTVLKD